MEKDVNMNSEYIFFEEQWNGKVDIPEPAPVDPEKIEKEIQEFKEYKEHKDETA